MMRGGFLFVRRVVVPYKRWLYCESLTKQKSIIDLEIFLLVIGFFGCAVVIKAFLPPKKQHHPIRPRPSKPRPVDVTVTVAVTVEKVRVVEQVKQIVGAAFVIDGDSIIIQKTEIRLFGVDAPEFNHPYGKKAKWALVRLCKGQQVTAEIVSQDAHGRAVARCHLGDGRDLSAEMVKLGLAIDWPKFSGGIYRDLEVPDARRKMWLADARQKGRMHVWEKFESSQQSECD